jgi:hypothetical protein
VTDQAGDMSVLSVQREYALKPPVQMGQVLLALSDEGRFERERAVTVFSINSMKDDIDEELKVDPTWTTLRTHFDDT